MFGSGISNLHRMIKSNFSEEDELCIYCVVKCIQVKDTAMLIRPFRQLVHLYRIQAARAFILTSLIIIQSSECSSNHCSFIYLPCRSHLFPRCEGMVHFRPWWWRWWKQLISTSRMMWHTSLWIISSSPSNSFKSMGSFSFSCLTHFFKVLMFVQQRQ